MREMKFIKQHEQRDCGATCLSMIASYYGLQYPISKYRELTKTDQNGTNLYGLCDAARKLGLEAEALSGNLSELLDGVRQGNITFPFVAHITNEDKMQHFLVVLNIKNGRVSVADPAKGKVKYTVEQFAELWNGYIVTFEKTDDFQSGNHQRGGFKRFFSLLKGQYRRLATILVFSLVVSAIGIIGAFVFEVMIDEFYTENQAVVCEDDCEDEHEHITGESANILDRIVGLVANDASDFNMVFLCLIALYILQAVVQFLRGYLISSVSKRIDMRLMIPYYDHIMDLPISAVNTRKTGEYLSRFSDARAIRDAVSGATLTLMLDSIMVIGCGTILYLENKELFLVSLLVIGLYAAIIIFYKNPLERVNREVMENNARLQSYLKESIDGIETIKAHTAETCVKEKNCSRFTAFVSSVFENNVLSVSQDVLCSFVELVGSVIILWLGFGMVLQNQVTIGSLMTFYALLAYFTEPIKNLIGLQPMIQTALIAAERLSDVLDMRTEECATETYHSLPFGDIRISDLDFRYGNHELTLRNLSMEIKHGEKIAIVGESGCGKTTLAKLLMKFYKAEKGEILVGDQPIENISAKELRRKIAYIDQNTILFSDTVRNNLLLGDVDASDEEIEYVCKLVKADEFISRLPFGYDTFLEENGKNLSGGQKQRLAIARALLRRPELIIFDEATSNLDTITEGALKETIFNINKDVTCIIIAHRLSTVKECDRIIVMDNGSVIEIGTHRELIERKSRYYQLYSRQ